MKLFDEDEAFDLVCEAGAFSTFANAFLVIAGTPSENAPQPDGARGDRTLSVKYNRLRKPAFRIATQIFEKPDGSLHVPNARLPLEDGDVLWLVGEHKDIDALMG